MRSPLIKLIALSAVALGVTLGLGILRPGLTTATLQRHAQERVERCMHDAGPRASQRAVERCWSVTAKDPQFSRLGLVDPIASTRRLRAEGFRAWRCVERAGYVRTTGIPLSDTGDYPLRVAAGNFRVGPTDADLERFYGAAAECAGESLASFRWSDGSFSRDPADGAHRCIRHHHASGPAHSHGCATAADIPDRPGGPHR